MSALEASVGGAFGERVGSTLKAGARCGWQGLLGGTIWVGGEAVVGEIGVVGDAGTALNKEGESAGWNGIPWTCSVVFNFLDTNTTAAVRS